MHTDFTTGKNSEVVLHWDNGKPFIWAEDFARVLHRNVDDVIYDITRLAIIAVDRTMVKGEVRVVQKELPNGRKSITYALTQTGAALYLNELDIYATDPDACHRIMDAFDAAIGQEWMKIPRRIVTLLKNNIMDHFK